MKLLSGQRAFVAQRLSAAVMLAAVIVGALRVALGPAPTFEGWRAWSGGFPGAVILLLVAAAVIVHAWVGLRDVVLDYVHAVAIRLAILLIIAAGLSGLAGWILLVVARHAISNTAL